jgi:hypothetical protein
MTAETTKRSLLFTMTAVAAAAAADGNDMLLRLLHDRPIDANHRRGGGLRKKNGHFHQQEQQSLLHHQQQRQQRTSFQSKEDNNPTITSRRRHLPNSRRRRLPQAMGTPTATDGDGDARNEGGAFNPNLVAYDPNSSEYQFDHSSSSSSTGSEIPPPDDNWSPCPIDNLNFSGHRASYDCTSYIECTGGQPRGEYISCMGLKFDNEKGVCDWAESVICAYEVEDDDPDETKSDSAGNAESEEEENDEDGGGGGEVGDVDNNEETIGSITDYDIDMTNSAGSNGAEANTEVTGWSGGSDWGGSWIDGVWYVWDSFICAHAHK